MNKQVGKMIESRLGDLGRTQVWLANEVGVSNNAVTKWKQTGNIASENLVAVAKALQITVDELLTDSGPVPAANLSSEGSKLERLDADEARLVALYRESNQEARELVLAQLAIHAAQNAAASGLPRIRNKT